MTSGMRFTMQAAEVWTPSARSTRIFDGDLPSTARVMFVDSPSVKRPSSMCALAVGASAVCGAARGIRTPDPLITNEVLYQLSYCGFYFRRGFLIAERGGLTRVLDRGAPTWCYAAAVGGTGRSACGAVGRPAQ